MRRGARGAIGACLLVLLAGCSQPAEDALVAVVPAATNDTTLETNATTAVTPDLRDPPKSPATNVTRPAPPDAWGNVDRLVVFDDQVELSGGSVEVRPVRPVPQGTGSVEILAFDPQYRVCEPLFTHQGEFVCTDALGIEAPVPAEGTTELGLSTRHAATVEWSQIEPMSWGEPVLVELGDPTQADPYFTPYSLWDFTFSSPNALDAQIVVFHVTIVAIRAPGPLPPVPVLRETFGEEHARLVLDVDWRSSSGGFLGISRDAIVPDESALASPNLLISEGTRSLHVWLNISEAEVLPVAGATEWFLWHHNASRRDNATNLFDTPSDAREMYWVLPVSPADWDPPYADGSRWGFGLGASWVEPTGHISCYAQCGAFSAAYHITVIATDVALPFESYDWYCLRNDECPG